MTEDALYPISEAEQLVEGFLSCQLEKGEFTHEAHLITGLYLLAKHRDETLPIIRKHLMDYLASIGVESTDTSGYHETMTVFWLWRLKKQFADEKEMVHWNQNNIDDLIEDFDMTERNIWLEHYSKELMMSVEARKEFVEPDLKPLE